MGIIIFYLYRVTFANLQKLICTKWRKRKKNIIFAKNITINYVLTTINYG